MRLMSRSDILEAMAGPSPRLVIDNFEPAELQSSAYYFRLGDEFARWGGGSDDGWYDQFGDLPAGTSLKLGGSEYVRIWSYEAFRLEAGLLGIMGPVSDIARFGVNLICSSFIDPRYPDDELSAPLEMGLQNLSGNPAVVPARYRIGKVVFFDVSDTAIESIDPTTAIGRKFGQRRGFPQETWPRMEDDEL